MASPTEGKRRFAPIPIETTFEQYRKPGNMPGPAGEPTPDPSPEPSPKLAAAPVLLFEPAEVCITPASHDARREKRRFAPQLIDSSRRSRRTGDVGPATRPTDKTDITPHHNHIYSVQRSRKRHNKITGLARRESCDEETADHMYDLAKKEIEKRLQEIALSAFPNSGQRIGGAEHFVAREGSDDGSDDAPGDADARGRPQVRVLGTPRPRRDSTDEDINWHVKEAQDAADRRARSRVNTRDLDEMQLDSPPTDTMWLTSSRKETPSPQPFLHRERGPIGETHMPLISQSPLSPIGESTMPLTSSSLPPIKPIGEYVMPFIPSAPPGRAADMPFIPAETGFSRHGAAARPFGGGFRRPVETDRNLDALRRHSPPMLGADLTFRKCPSPKHTKLEPDHLWQHEADETNRDPTGQRGLWRGYCFTAESGEALAEIERPEMISTPSVPSSSATDPFSLAFGTTSSISSPLSDEPGQLEATPRPLSGSHSVGPPAPLHAHKRSGEAKGLHMLMGLEERLRKEKAAADLADQIQAEFNDRFVTQVYNYLSLGYPAMARSYDDELSKISRIPLGDLQRDDDALMDGVVAAACGRGAKGHIKLTEDDDTKEQDRCPRWKALKLYIHEWASQHPDLDTISPLAWGVKERRGSWGI